jgi:EAL domain-containing protein (putative c-di-GMP-specific phosphodiesterase class I)/GGDEF domain-containing protein
MRDAESGLVSRVALVARLQDQLSLGLRVGIVAVGLDWSGGPAADTDGTLAGTVAKRVVAGLRGSDLVASFGGDGLVALVSDVTTPELLHAVARRLVAAAGGPVVVMADRLDVRASASFALVAGTDLDAEQVVAAAVRGWRRARVVDEERVAPFDPTGADDERPITWSASELERALQAGEFEAWFQPVVDVGTADLAGFEALLRWDHPELGLLEPARFLDAAERAGVLGRIGTEVMRQALRHLVRWDTRVQARPLTMAVNLSARQLAQADLAETLGDLLAAGGLPPERVRVDVAAELAGADPDGVAARLAELRRHGIPVCLDGFGVGADAIGLLQRLPVDVVKLGRGALDGGDAEPARGLLEAMVRFGHSVGAVVAAEGVETPRELSVLRQVGCDQAQGRLFSGPRRAAEIDTMLDRWLGVAAVGAPRSGATARR